MGFRRHAPQEEVPRPEPAQVRKEEEGRAYLLCCLGACVDERAGPTELFCDLFLSAEYCCRSTVTSYRWVRPRLGTGWSLDLRETGRHSPTFKLWPSSESICPPVASTALLYTTWLHFQKNCQTLFAEKSPEEKKAPANSPAGHADGRGTSTQPPLLLIRQILNGREVLYMIYSSIKAFVVSTC